MSPSIFDLHAHVNKGTNPPYCIVISARMCILLTNFDHKLALSASLILKSGFFQLLYKEAQVIRSFNKFYLDILNIFMNRNNFIRKNSQIINLEILEIYLLETYCLISLLWPIVFIRYWLWNINFTIPQKLVSNFHRKPIL